MQKNTPNVPNKKKKSYDFTLLQRRKAYMRIDAFIVSTATAALFYTFGKELSNMENIAAIGFMIIAIAFNGIILLLNFWSIAAHEFYAFSRLAPECISKCTDVKAIVYNPKTMTTARYIVPMIRTAVQMQKDKVNNTNCIELQKKKFIYTAQKKTFSQIPYPVDYTIEEYQNNEGLATEQD